MVLHILDLALERILKNKELLRLIEIKHKGDFSKTIDFLKKSSKAVQFKELNKFGEEGVAALSSATPVDSGLTARSWNYKITTKGKVTTISFNNTNIQNGVPIAIILQYGHGTRNGGWVQGRDYINPAIQGVFDRMADAAWREVTKV